MYADDELLPISALQHLLFCERQCALIHLEQVWSENRLTVEGRHLHRKVHESGDQRRGRVWIARGVPLRSSQLGLIGQADVVEIEPPTDWDRPRWTSHAIWEQIRQSNGHDWRITPIEYKRGRPKKDNSDRVQLAAQALCLEEMLGVSLVSGAIFYGQQQRRREIVFDAALRALVATVSRRLRELIESRKTPAACREAKCDNCSLVEICLPKATTPDRSAAAFAERQFRQHLAAPFPENDWFSETDEL